MNITEIFKIVVQLVYVGFCLSLLFLSILLLTHEDPDKRTKV